MDGKDLDYLSAFFPIEIHHEGGATRGTHLVAKRSIEAGELVLVDRPLVFALEDKEINRHCGHCLAPLAKEDATSTNANQISCGCGFATFCSATCAARCELIHRLECPVLLSLEKEQNGRDTAPKLDSHLRLLLRVMLLLTYERAVVMRTKEKQKQTARHNAEEAILEKKKSSGRCSTTSFGAQVDALISNKDRMSAANLQEIKTTSLYLLRSIHQAFSSPPSSSCPASSTFSPFRLLHSSFASTMVPDLEECVEVLCRIQCNAFGVCDVWGECKALGLYTRYASFFNHSCSPNVGISFSPSSSLSSSSDDEEEGDEENAVNKEDEEDRTWELRECFSAPRAQLYARAAEAIEAGEELQISYISMYKSRHQRQAYLLQKYCFHCQCRRCQNEQWAIRDRYITAIRCQLCSPSLASATSTSTPASTSSCSSSSSSSSYSSSCSSSSSAPSNEETDGCFFEKDIDGSSKGDPREEQSRKKKEIDTVNAYHDCCRKCGKQANVHLFEATQQTLFQEYTQLVSLYNKTSKEQIDLRSSLIERMEEVHRQACEQLNPLHFLLLKLDSTLMNWYKNLRISLEATNNSEDDEDKNKRTSIALDKEIYFARRAIACMEYIYGWSDPHKRQLLHDKAEEEAKASRTPHCWLASHYLSLSSALLLREATLQCEGNTKQQVIKQSLSLVQRAYDALVVCVGEEHPLSVKTRQRLLFLQHLHP